MVQPNIKQDNYSGDRLVFQDITIRRDTERYKAGGYFSVFKTAPFDRSADVQATHTDVGR